PVKIAIRNSMKRLGRQKHLEFGGELPPRKMREEAARHLLCAYVKKCFQISRRLRLHLRQVRIEALQQQRTHLRIRPDAPEAPDLGLLEKVVAAEDLVRPLACEHHLVAALAHEPREKVKGRRSGAEQRLLGVPDDAWKDASYVA